MEEKGSNTFYVRAIATKVSKETIIHRENRGIMLLLIRVIVSEEITGIVIINTVEIMVKEEVDHMGMEKVREPTWEVMNKGTIHLWDIIQTK